MGAQVLVDHMRRFEQSYGAAFTPCQVLSTLHSCTLYSILYTYTVYCTVYTVYILSHLSLQLLLDHAKSGKKFYPS